MLKPNDIDYQVKQYLTRAIDIYDGVFVRGEKPTEREVVALIAQLIEMETNRVTLLIQLETLLAQRRKSYGE